MNDMRWAFPLRDSGGQLTALIGVYDCIAKIHITMTDTSPDIVTKLRGALATITVQPDELVLQTALNEAWFSNTLAWLLNPRGSHGLGVTFCNEFVALVAQRRTEHHEGVKYARRATFLKWGKGGTGVGATGFGFQMRPCFANTI